MIERIALSLGMVGALTIVRFGPDLSSEDVTGRGIGPGWTSLGGHPIVAAMHPLQPYIFPLPKQIQATDDTLHRVSHLKPGEIAEAASGAFEDFAHRLGDHRIRVDSEDVADSLGLSVRISRIAASDSSEAYRLLIGSRQATLEAGSPAGFLRGFTTLEQILTGLQSVGNAPGLAVTDWPSMPYRGLFIEDKWGPDLMEIEDWKGIVDYLASLKMNVLGVGIYGCWNVQYDGQVSEFLMVPVPGHPELETRRSIRWYSPGEERLCEIEYAPRMFEGDFLEALVGYGKARGVEVVPFVNSLGHNTLFPRLIPGVSARRSHGSPTGYGYCLSSPETWDFISSFYASIVDRYLKPHGVRTFHIQMDEIYPILGADPGNPLDRVDPDCRCDRCSTGELGARIQEYVIRLTGFLRDQGMENVVIWNDQLTRHMDLIDDAFLARLEAEGLRDTLVVHWWWYDNASIHDRVHPRIGRGLRAWMGPMSCYYNWAYFRVNRPNIPIMLELGHEEAAEGGVSYSVFDPANDLDFRLMAAGTWDGPDSLHNEPQRWANQTAPGQGEALMEALSGLDAAARSPAVRRVAYYTYTYPAEDRAYPRPYPLEALEALETSHEEASLERMGSDARKARRILKDLCARADTPSWQGEVLQGLHAEAVRLDVLAGVFEGLLNLRAAPDAQTADVADSLRRLLEKDMAIIETAKPAYLRPSVLRDLSVLHEFLGQLGEDILAAGAPAKRPLRWSVEPNIAQRGAP